MSNRVLTSTFDNVLFTNAELHMLLDSVPSIMDDSTSETFANVCEEFIQDNLKMPNFDIISFGVIVTGQALLNQSHRYLVRGVRRVSDQEKPLAVNTVVSVEYTHPDGDRIDPSDFHRYLRLLVNSRGSQLVKALQQADASYFQSTRTIVSFSSEIKNGTSDDESEEVTTNSGTLNSWTIAAVAVAGVSLLFLAAAIIAHYVRIHRFKNTQRSLQRRIKLPSHDEAPDFLDLTQERTCPLDAATSPSSTPDFDRYSLGGPCNSLVTLSDEYSQSPVRIISPDQRESSGGAQGDEEAMISPLLLFMPESSSNDASSSSLRKTTQHDTSTNSVKSLRSDPVSVDDDGELSDDEQPIQSTIEPQELHYHDSLSGNALIISHLATTTSEIDKLAEAEDNSRSYPEDDEGYKDSSDGEHKVKGTIKSETLPPSDSLGEEEAALSVFSDVLMPLKGESSVARSSDKRSQGSTASTRKTKPRRKKSKSKTRRHLKNESSAALNPLVERQNVISERSRTRAVPAPWKAVGLALTPVITLQPNSSFGAGSASMSSISESDTDSE